jgi:hypothetical protein
MSFAAVLLFATLPFVDCPTQAKGNASFLIVDEAGRALPGAQVRFTATTWDSTLVYTADADGKVDVVCVPLGGYYDVTFLHPSYESVHVSVIAEEEPQTKRIVMKCAEGRYARVTLDGYPVPGATVIVGEANEFPWAQGTDDDGLVVYPELHGEGESFMATSLDGFVPQRTLLRGSDRNGPIRFELTVIPHKGMTVVTGH